MFQLFSQLGIDWHLLISQAANFLILLIILRLVAYKPLLKILHKRRETIEEGLIKAKEADVRLRDIEEIGKGKIKEAETQSLRILKKTESDAKVLEAKLFAEAKRKEAEELKNTEALLRAEEVASRRAMEKEAAALVKAAIIKTVELSPESIDDALITKAIKGIRGGEA
jgi:F-type H+-transporting ATPase subunit b